jgi:hypothetical protein
MANTFDASLVVDVLRDSAITVLQSRLAPLNVFTKDFSADTIAPRKTVLVPLATAGGTTQTNATNFESGNSTLGVSTVVVDQYSNSFALTNAEINQGFRIENIAKINLHNLANKIMDIALAPVTTTNFGAAVVDVDTAALVTAAELRTLWAALKDGDVRNLVVDGSIYANFLPSNLEAFNLATGGRNTGIYGYDFFGYNNRWTGAGATIKGFACSPQAIACASGVPQNSPASSDMISQENVVIPDLGLTVQMNMWVSRATRDLWCSYDVMFGAAVADTTALKIIKLTP